MSAQTRTDAGRGKAPEAAPQHTGEKAAQAPRRTAAFDPGASKPQPQPRSATASQAGFGSFG